MKKDSLRGIFDLGKRYFGGKFLPKLQEIWFPQERAVEPNLFCYLNFRTSEQVVEKLLAQLIRIGGWR